MKVIKARIADTGKMVKVRPITVNKVLVFEDEDMHLYGAEDLEFEKNPFYDNIDWEQRKFELVKSALQGMSVLRIWNNENDLADWTLKIADAVIKKLSREENDIERVTDRS